MVFVDADDSIPIGSGVRLKYPDPAPMIKPEV